MANPTCTKANLTAGKACLGGPLLTNHQMLTRLVYMKMLELAAIGGTNYTSDAESLNVAANALTCGFQPNDMISAYVTIASNNATAAGASVPATKQALAAAVACFEDFTDFQLQQADILLTCALGRGKTYPQ